MFIKALEAAMESVPENEEDVAAEMIQIKDKESFKRVPVRVQRADAIGVLAESFLQNGAAELSGGDKHQIIVHDRVALDDCSSRAPTDPDVQISRIRLFDLRIRCASVNTVNDANREQWIVVQ